MAIDGGRFLLIYMYKRFSVCMKEGHRNVGGAVWCMHISQAHFVAAGACDIGQEREGFFALANIQIVEVTVADKVAGILRVLPFANSSRLRTIHDNSWKVAGSNNAGVHRPRHFGTLGCQRFGILLCKLDLRLKVGDSRFVFEVNRFLRFLQRQRALHPFGYVRMLQ